MVVVIYLHSLWLAWVAKEVAKDQPYPLAFGGWKLARKCWRGSTHFGAREAEGEVVVFAVAAFVTVIYFCYAFLSHNFAHSVSRLALVRNSIFCSCG